MPRIFPINFVFKNLKNGRENKKNGQENLKMGGKKSKILKLNHLFIDTVSYYILYLQNVSIRI